MRLLTKSDIIPKPVPFRTLDGEYVVRLRCGPLWYELLPGEAADLGRALIAVAEVDQGWRNPLGHTESP